MTAHPPPPETPEEIARRLEIFNQVFCGMVPHNAALGMRIVGYAESRITTVLPWSPRIVGNPETGVLHGGAVTAFIDATCGGSVYVRLLKPIPVATLDLRIDYLRPAETRRELYADAVCYHVTRNVAFVRAVAYHDRPEDAIATAAGTFMIASPGATVMERPAADVADPAPATRSGGEGGAP